VNNQGEGEHKANLVGLLVSIPGGHTAEFSPQERQSGRTYSHRVNLLGAKVFPNFQLKELFLFFFFFGIIGTEVVELHPSLLALFSIRLSPAITRCPMVSGPWRGLSASQACCGPVHTFATADRIDRYAPIPKRQY
jgi:hypothetical protein